MDRTSGVGHGISPQIRYSTSLAENPHIFIIAGGVAASSRRAGFRIGAAAIGQLATR
jgi:hypothetical protein